jgi:cytochrome b561
MIRSARFVTLFSPLNRVAPDRGLEQHSIGTVFLHWASVVALVVAASSAIACEWIEDDRLRGLLMDIHRQSGNFVLLALGLRLAVRFSVGMADHAADLPPWSRIGARLAHWALYGLLLALPLLGLAASNAHATRVTLFGLLALPPLVGADPDLADRLTDCHLWGSWLLLALVVLHIAAALWHHFIRRDGVLAAMLPMRRLR